MSPQRIQRRRVKGYRMPPGAVYVGRGAIWGNPFRIGDDTSWIPVDDSGVWSKAPHEPLTREQTVECFRFTALFRLRDDPGYLEALRGRDLACWCPLDQPCHADVLLELANPGTCDCGHGQDVHFQDGCVDKSGGGYFCQCLEFEPELANGEKP